MNFKITSTAFKNGDSIPIKYTRDGDNISPQLAWESTSKNTESFLLLVDDYDAPNGLWNHWLVYNIPKNINNLAEGIESLPEPAKFGKNTYKKLFYDGPCPPIPEEHTYHFKLFALNNFLKPHHRVSRTNIEEIMKHHVLEVAILIGSYKRSLDKNKSDHNNENLEDATTIIKRKDISSDIKKRAAEKIKFSTLNS